MSLSGSPLVRHRYAVLAVLVTVLTTVQTVNGQWSSDMWEHVAVVRELIARPFDPSHPQVLSDATHPGFSPYTVTLGLLGHAFDIDAVTLLSLAAVLNVVLVLVTLRLLVLEATANERATFWALLFVLALWGTSPYRYSGFFNLNSIGFVAPYPSTFATAVGFGTLVAALRYARSGRRRLLVPVALGTAVVTLVHPLSAPWLVMSLLAVVISRMRDLRTVAWFGGAVGLSMALCLLWPHYSLADLVRDPTDLDALNRSMYTNVLARTFPMWLGLVVIVRRTRADRRDVLGLLLAGSVALYVVGAVSDDTSFGRSLAFVVIVLAIAVADGVARIEASPPARRRSRPVRAATIGLAALVVFGLVTTRAGLSRMVPTSLLPASVRDAAELVRPDEQYGFLEDLVGPTDVVIGSRREDNLVIPALAGRSLALGVPRPFVTDAEERASAQREYLDPATTAVRRDQIEDRYHVRFVLLGAAHPALLEVLEREGAEVVHRGDGLTLLELPGG